jgi:hypothetical protein
LYRDVAWQTLTLSTGLASIAGTVLEATSFDVDFASATLPSGGVVVIAGAVYEVAGYIDAALLAVSKLRADVADVQIPLASATNQPFAIRSFRPQIAWVHAQFMAMAGLRVGEESKVLNRGDAKRLAVLGVLAMVYGAAAAMEPANGMYTTRAAMYRRRFADERGRTVLLIDHDGNGKVDEQRLLHAGRMIRG